MKQERIEAGRLAEEALPGTKAAIEKEGYLYHYAPKSKRDLIAKQGIIGNQAATAAQGPGKAFFFLNPEGHSLAQFAPSETDLDLYRVKTTSEMLDQLKVDDHLPLKGGIGQSVYLEGDIAQRGIQAELMPNIIDTTSGKIVSQKTAVEFANGTMRYDLEGKSYFLHHSPSSEIAIGEKIRTTRIGRQVTATDAIQGHSYAWDARTGLEDAVANQVSLRGGFLPEGGMPRDYSVYLTSADTKNVYPDINVPGSSARAIKGEQQVLDKITIPANLSDQDATNLVQKMTRKHGIFQANDKPTRQMIDDSVLASRGEEALGNFLEGHGEGVIKGHIKNIEKQIADGGIKGIYAQDKILPHLGQLGKVVESEGPDAAYSFAKKQFTPDALGLDVSKLSAQVSSKAIGTTGAMIDKAVQAQEMIRSAQTRTGLLTAATEASSYVAGGVKKSGLLRQAAAAATILGKRI